MKREIHSKIYKIKKPVELQHTHTQKLKTEICSVSCAIHDNWVPATCVIEYVGFLLTFNYETANSI